MLPKWQPKNHEALALSVSKLLDERLSLMRDGDVTTAIRVLRAPSSCAHGQSFSAPESENYTRASRASFSWAP